MTMVFVGDISIVNGICKPTYIWGHHLVGKYWLVSVVSFKAVVEVSRIGHIFAFSDHSEPSSRLESVFFPLRGYALAGAVGVNSVEIFPHNHHGCNVNP